ncbi:MAG TPA: hypothetical protein VF912_17685 [Anaeromyxobacter sp.]
MSVSSRWVVCAFLLLPPALARSGDAPDPGGSEPQASPPQSAGPEQVLPPAEEPAPQQAPPAPPSAIPPAPPRAQAPAPQQAPVPPGQWVYTAQYGWIWMPYSDAYTYAPPNGYGEPYMYVYYPVYGWTWLAAPWVWGWGPWPAFGLRGPAFFAWYGWGGWRQPWRTHFHPGVAPYRPPPYRFAPGARLPLRSGAVAPPRAYVPRGHAAAPARGGGHARSHR